MKLNQLYVISFLFLALACGKKKDDSYFDNPAPFAISSIQFDDSVSSEHQDFLRKDFDLVTRMSFSNSDSEDAKVLGISDFSNTSLAKWLTDRTKYVVGENYSEYSNISVAQYNKTFSPTLFADSGFYKNKLEAANVVTIMSNIGALYYLKGKSESKLYTLTVAGKSENAVSPRVGIIQIGEGLFSSTRFSLDSIAGSISRISTLFHESHHTDGNGSNAGFTHQKCPTSMPDYANEYACDKYTNGPYSVQAVILKKYSSTSCENCTTEELSKLQLLVADKYSRVMSGSTHADPSPEKTQ